MTHRTHTCRTRSLAGFLLAATLLLGSAPGRGQEAAPEEDLPRKPTEEPAPPSADQKQEAQQAAQQEAQQVAQQVAYEPPAPRFEKWLKEVSPLIFGVERLAFIKLRTDYQRDAFIREFWRSRDPYPETARNELRDRWERNIELARSLYAEDLEDDRARILLIYGEPETSFEVRCTKTRKPAEVWFYSKAATVDFPFLLVFLKHRGVGAARIWKPGAFSADLILESSRKCINGELLANTVTAIRRSNDYELTLSRILAKPRPRSSEWLANFQAFSTDLPRDAELFRADFDLEYLGRYQSRTVVQGLLRIPLEESTLSELGGYRSYDFLVTGEVVSSSGLFENFRYKFGFPAEGSGLWGEAGSVIPLAFQRYLRPGSYELVLKVEDLNSGKLYRQARSLEVPQMDQAVASRPRVDPYSADLFAEATAAIAGGETSIKIIPPRSDLVTGFVRFDTLAKGERIAKVTFSMDGRPVMTKNRPPYNVEIDLGPFPRTHALEVSALDPDGEAIAHDRLLLNAGAHRFSVQLLEPRRGKRYEASLLARAEVEAPPDRTLERVEFFLNETLVATLFQEPFTQPISLPAGRELTFVRAVAYLTDGTSAEDLVFVNAPENLDQVDVQLVELYATVFDRSSRPVQGLRQEQFRVREDKVPQTLSRFEAVGDLPIHVGILLDNSGSMRGALQQARAAALKFFQQAITPKDRAAVITFNRFPSLAVKLTNDLKVLGGGLAGLTAEGETSLYDSVMFGLYYFGGLKGQRALLLLSDGSDEGSRFTFEETLEYARRSGITLYSIGLNLRDPAARGALKTLADETGGRSFFIPTADQLEGIYNQIQEDLRSQYFLAYQSSNSGKEESFRSIEVIVDQPGLEAKTISGYYP